MGMWSGTLERARLQANAGPPVHDDFWYGPAGGGITLAGERVSDETALKLAMVYACARVLWETVGSLPWLVYRRLPKGGKERATDHPYYRLLHDKPNDDQTSMEFRETVMRWLIFQGNSVCRVRWAPGRTGIEAREIDPLEMDRVDIKLVRTGDGEKRIEYWYREEGESSPRRLSPESVIHYKAMGKSRWVGDSVLGYARETIGVGLGYQRMNSRIQKRGLNPSMVFAHPKQMSATAMTNFRESVETLYSGADNAGKVMVVEEDMKPLPISMKPTDLQWLESMVHNSRDIQRYFRMQPHKVQDLERSTNNNIEHQGLEHATDTIRPWCVRIETRTNLGLFDGPEVFSEILMDGLYRGDLEARSNYHSKAISFGWETQNEARVLENMNPLDQDGADELRQPPAQGEGQADGVDQRVGRKALVASTSASTSTRGEAIIRGVAERCLKREREGLRRLAMKASGSAFARGVYEFYAEHRRYLEDALAVDAEAAEDWCGERAVGVIDGGLKVAEGWTVESVLALVEVGDV